MVASSGWPGCLACLHREGTNLYTPKSGSQPRQTNTNHTLRPALSIHQEHSGRESPGPSIPPLAPWKVRVSILILQLTGTAVGMAPSQQPISLLQDGLWQRNQGSEGQTPAPQLVLPHGTGISALHRLAAPSITHHSHHQSRAHPYKPCGRTGDSQPCVPSSSTVSASTAIPAHHFGSPRYLIAQLMTC